MKKFIVIYATLDGCDYKTGVGMFQELFDSKENAREAIIKVIKDDSLDWIDRDDYDSEEEYLEVYNEELNNLDLSEIIQEDNDDEILAWYDPNTVRYKIEEVSFE